MDRRAINTDTDLRVFDDMERTDQDHGRYSATSFESLNRKPWKSAELARRKLEQWFAKIPLGKQNDLRGRLRGDDRAHSGALLELLIHELLLTLCKEVVVEPEIAGGRPDFSAVYAGTRLIVECTVAQESDKKFGALRRERTVLDIVDALDAGPYKLIVEPKRVGSQQPPGAALTKYLEEQLASLGANGAFANALVGNRLDRPISWEWKDWKLRFWVFVMGDDSRGRTVGGRLSGLMRDVDDGIIARALERKAEAYSRLALPYLVVVSQREGTGNGKALMDAVLGPERWLLSENSGEVERCRRFDGFFGSPSNPRNRHVSAILYKRDLKSVWSIQNQWTSYESGSNYQPPDWTLVHHPAALNPLPEGIFPFAVEHVSGSETPTGNPTHTLNAVLGLPDPWPGEER